MARSRHPINTLALMLKDISEGEGDLTQIIRITSQNELGDLAHYFNLTIDTIKRLVLTIKKETSSLAQTGLELVSNMTETAVSINEITANIQSIKNQTKRQMVGVKGTNGTMKQVVEHIDRINDQIQKQADCVSESSSAIEQMLANIQSVTQSFIKNKDNRVVQKPQFLNNFRLKNSKMRSILQDLFDNQPGY